MAYQGEYFIERYGKEAVARTPPIRLMLAAGLPVGGTPMYPEQNRLDRMEALRRYTVGSSWFSSEDDRKGALMPGQFADFAALTDDYFTIDEPQIKYLTSVLTVVNGKVVYADEEFSSLAPPPLPVSPSWSPVTEFGGYSRYRPVVAPLQACADGCVSLCGIHGHGHLWAWRSNVPASDANGFWGALGCSCFAF